MGWDCAFRCDTPDAVMQERRRTSCAGHLMELRDRLLLEPPCRVCRLSVPAIATPEYPPRAHPEMAFANVGLTHRWMDGRSAQPIHRDSPSRPLLRAQRKLDLLATAAGASKASPFVDAASAHDDEPATSKFIGTGVFISAFRDKVGAAQRSSPLKETPEQIPPCVFHSTRSMNGSTSPRPQ